MKLKDSKLFRQQCYVNGQWADADGGETIEVTNPVDGSVIGTVPAWATAETRRAIEAAEVAQKEWRMLTGKERAAILRKWFDLMMENQEDLAILMTTEQGKPLPNPVARSPMRPPLSSGSPKRPSASMATPSPAIPATAASS